MNLTFRIPAEFVIAHARLNWLDLRFGLERAFISSQDVVVIAMDYLSRHDDASPTEIELAGLLRDETHRVPELIGALTETADLNNGTKDRWLYLLLYWLYEHRESVEDPLGLVEEIYADFDYPEDISCFVRYMPSSEGYRSQDHSKEENLARLYRLWHEYLLKHRLL